jgi:transposase-like protein
MGKYKRYSDEFKRDVLAMVAEGKRSVGEIERDLGLTAGIIYKWQGRYQVKGTELKPSDERSE